MLKMKIIVCFILLFLAYLCLRSRHLPLRVPIALAGRDHLQLLPGLLYKEEKRFKEVDVFLCVHPPPPSPLPPAGGSFGCLSEPVLLYFALSMMKRGMRRDIRALFIRSPS